MDKEKVYSIVRELLLYVILILLCVFVIPKYVIQRTVVDGGSMEDTLHDGESLLVEKISYRFHDPERFDIVVFYPNEEDRSEYYVKRVIGLPGEVIQIVDDDIYINGELIEEDFGKQPMVYSGIAEEPYVLGEDEFFVLGDNRYVSFDSRYEEVGPVPKDRIAGHAFLRIWPLNKISTFQ
ncbi:MAG: signal peptidase I [Acetatifactor sp.]|nr:signal peptidase I [Acetatifactor sp.]